MRANTNISLKERLQLKLGDFKGVDFSTSPLRVQANRASNMSNFINEYGVNRKRSGWNELFRILDENGEALKINNIINYVNGTHKEMIVHAGSRFFRISYNNETNLYSYTDITLSGTYAPSIVDTTLLKDQRSQSFFHKGRCYIIGCGDYLVYGTWNNGTTYELRRVANNEDTYIPTTTIAINDESIDDDTRNSLDDMNFLNSKRINKLVGSTSTNKTWTLDTGKIDADTDVEITLETIEGPDNIAYVINNSGADKTNLYKVKRNGEDISPAVLCGTLNYSDGRVTLTCSTVPQSSTKDNIYVKFECKVEGYIERISNCNFGTLFGLNGNTDRLFLSGNSEYPNIDFHSEMDDYTYFGDFNMAAMGSDAVAVNGYARLSDNTLVIYKEENGYEASIFYRTGIYKEYYDSQGNLDKAKEVFPISAGGIGEGVVSRYACANFGGDNIILSRNGVFGIVLANNVATTERYTRERSRSINEKLKKHTNLSEAVGIVYKNRYYLSIDNVCYVADARFKYSSSDDLDNSFNYEWWYWENIPARVFANIDNALYFGSASGQVCVFDDIHIDRTYQTSEAGDLAINIAENKITYSQNIDIGLEDNDIIKLTTNGIYALFLDEFTIENGKIYLSEDVISNIYEGIEVYADEVGESGLSVNTLYKVTEVDKGLCCFELEDSLGNVIEILDGGFRLHKLISQKELQLYNVQDASFQLKLANEVLQLSNYNSSLPSTPLARITHNENVVAKWYSPIFDLGTNESSKTLLKMTIATEPEVNGKVSFGYETKNIDKLINAKGVNLFSFDNFSFENFSFDTGFANSYSVKVKERNFNFIIFRFISDNEFDCAINNFTIIYKVNKSNKGVR